MEAPFYGQGIDEDKSGGGTLNAAPRIWAALGNDLASASSDSLIPDPVAWRAWTPLPGATPGVY